jgi:hypothetical protein
MKAMEMLAEALDVATTDATQAQKSVQHFSN